MSSIAIVGDLINAINGLPKALKEIPSNQRKARSDILDTVTSLSDAVSQALNVVSTRCGRLILKKNNLKEFKEGLVELPQLLNEFRLNEVCSTLGKVRAELRTILSSKRFSIRLFYRRKLESLLDEIQQKERDLEEDFDELFRDLSRRATRLRKKDVNEIVEFLRESQVEFEDDTKAIRSAMRDIESNI